jgi:hypothetical protein
MEGKPPWIDIDTVLIVLSALGAIAAVCSLIDLL